MHGVLAFIAGICTTIGVILLALAISGVTYYGVTPQAQLSIALTALIIAAIAIVILYFAFQSRKYKIETGLRSFDRVHGQSHDSPKPERHG